MIKDKPPQLTDVLTQTLKLSPLDKTYTLLQRISRMNTN